LGQSLRKVANGGSDVFYRGELARQIVQASQKMGGLFTAEDLAEYEPWWEEPIEIDYRGYRVLSAPPNSDGFQMLQTLKILEGYQPNQLDYGSAETLHRMIEATKLAITDRIKYAGDPNHTHIPLAGLLSSQYAAEQRARIDMNAAAAVQGEYYNPGGQEGALPPGNMDPALMGSTTHLAVADSEGNVVTLTQSLGSGFGSGIAIGETGIFLNNVANWFDVATDVEVPNNIGPRRLVEWCPTPAQVFKDGKFYLSIGTPGGYGIAQTTAQMLMHVLDFGMNVQQAIEAPRFKCTIGRSVELEERFSPDVRDRLAGRGQQVVVLEPWDRGVGGAQGIMVDQAAGVLSGGADPRRDGYAMGW
jgi:gamma-glutamyltranspeptidase/glutathione hydrolase